MLLPQPLTRGRIVQRYKRFFCDLVLDDGREITAHCPNSGAMLGVNLPGQGAWVSYSDDPKRKLAWTLQLVEAAGPDGTGLVGINTLLPNKLVAEALVGGVIPELVGYASIRPEVKYAAASRVDFLLTDPDRPPCWLEVKNVHLSRSPGLAEFPDCKAARSTRHLEDLAAQVREGHRAVALFVVQREDCEDFQACRELDPAFAAGLDRAADAGVEIMVWACAMSTREIRISRRIRSPHEAFVA
ncbi:DNA/RNA nuclease SfsA [Caulobacter flavus]|uniref:Sugar fermentation stimulation protein homolog n=1 Tax=Caulobacter flavus TaxID=1679497 RepID=A0A2N5CZJ4_9CAUL|nr:DNA/RNA nuclease SfsA [Caulobacter flavus]AYV45080.1 DNA/RNA nuclease SfsA [Caulobacter flavus]PLR19239.1 DNA/RNA nuclease SfsA [Caulobacter flavus]